MTELVERLRGSLPMRSLGPGQAEIDGDRVRAERDEAADLIEALEARLAEAEKEREEARGWISQFRDNFDEGLRYAVTRAEKAEAAREALEAALREAPDKIAASLGPMVRDWFTGPNPLTEGGLEHVIKLRVQRLLPPSGNGEGTT